MIKESLNKNNLNELSLCCDNERNVTSGAGVVENMMKKDYFIN